MKVLIVIATILLTACPAAVCEHLQTQCANDAAQVCNADGQWQDVMNCSDVEPGTWECGVEDEEHTCIQITN